MNRELDSKVGEIVGIAADALELIHRSPCMGECPNVA
jgi:hypothetical protein